MLLTTQIYVGINDVFSGTIIKPISYVLIAFVAISLIVSSIIKLLCIHFH